jgi:hypothetical protein
MFTKPWIPQKFAETSVPPLLWKPHCLWSQRSIPETPLHQRQLPFVVASDFSARTPKGGRSSHLESGIPPGFAEFWASRSNCCVNKDTSRVGPLFRGAVHHSPKLRAIR